MIEGGFDRHEKSPFTRVSSDSIQFKYIAELLIANIVLTRYHIAMSNAAPAFLSRLARIVASEGYDHGLKPVQLQALRYLANANRFSRTPRALTAWLGQTKGTVSQTIAALERRALVARSGDIHDGRIIRLELTEAGLAVAQTEGDVASAMLAHLDDNEQATAEALLGKMLGGHVAARGFRPMGICHTCRHFQRGESSAAANRCALLGVALDDDDAQRICIEQEAV
jgi:DNA-binding MarR family transcriptional regulator